MPLRFELRDRQGEVLGATGPAFDAIPETLPELDGSEYPILSAVDPYGWTMFNGIQMRRCIDELERRLPMAPPPRAGWMRELIDLCQRGADIVDAQLWAVGD